LKRSDLRQICSFMLYGEEAIERTNKKPYEEQLKEVKELAYDILRDLSDGEIDSFKAEEKLSEILDTYREICTEMGAKLGANVLFQLLHTDEKD